MATEEHETTDRHDESDSAQFGDDPHGLNNTPFKEDSCVDCGAYVVSAKTYTGPSRCLGCARTHADVPFGSGVPEGSWYPVRASQTPQNARPTQTPTPTIERASPWAWACLECRMTGTATNPDHAIAMHKMHVGYACPCAPNLTILEVKVRLQRRQPLTDLYPADVPQMYLVDDPATGKYKAAFSES